MEITQNAHQNSKNRRRLVAQNTKLYYQVMSIQEQLRLMQPEPSNLADSSDQIIPQKSVLEEIAIQQKLIRKLRGQIQQYKLERAKDNVEYIIREEDELKIAKKQELQLLDEKKILLNKKTDKSIQLQKDVPYQTYEKQFLQNLTQVVHFNREQAAKITQIERQIRKYHLMKKAKNLSPSKPAQSLQTLTKEISLKVSARMNLERQWKPHFTQLDEQHANLLRQLAIKKDQLAVIEKQQKSWQIRLSAIRQSEDVLSDKERLQKVNINPKLRQKLVDYIRNEEDKKKKKVNQDQLKYQFLNKKSQQQKPQDEVKALGPPLPGIKKKEEKIIETMHNDKNITKKIDKNTVKKTKNDQNVITQISVPSNKQTFNNKIIRQDSLVSQAKSKINNQQRSQRLWQSENHSQISSQKGEEKSPNKKNNETPSLLLKLKEIGITTEAKLWNQQIIESVVQ